MEFRRVLFRSQRVAGQGIVEHPAQRTLLAFGEIVQVRVVGPVAFGFLLDVMLDRRKLVEALMTEAAIVRAGAEKCRPEERRVGNGVGGTGRSRWCPDD